MYSAVFGQRKKALKNTIFPGKTWNGAKYQGSIWGSHEWPGLALPNLQSTVSENDRKSLYINWNKCHLGEIN